MLKELSKKDKLWRELAIRITGGNRDEADEIVNEMYLRRYDNDRGQPCTDYYIVCTMRSIYLNGKNKNNPIPIAEIFNETLEDEQFEPDDTQQHYLDECAKLPYHKRELLELSYDHSLREIDQEFGINYWSVNRYLTEARKEILKDDFCKYKNKRLKYKR